MRDDGGYAFPHIAEVVWSGDPMTTRQITSGGMTLRDYFAAKALPECIRIAADQTPDDGLLSELFAKAAGYAWVMADTMLEARNEPRQ